MMDGNGGAAGGGGTTRRPPTPLESLGLLRETVTELRELLERERSQNR